MFNDDIQSSFELNPSLGSIWSLFAFIAIFLILFNIISEGGRNPRFALLIIVSISKYRDLANFEAFTEPIQSPFSKKLCIQSFSVNTESLGNTVHYSSIAQPYFTCNFHQHKSEPILDMLE